MHLDKDNKYGQKTVQKNLQYGPKFKPIKTTGSHEEGINALEFLISNLIGNCSENNPNNEVIGGFPHTPGRIRTAVAGSKVLHD